MKAIRIFLFVLIIIGIILLLTQKIWVPKLVNQILSSEDNSALRQEISTDTNSKINYTISSECPNGTDKMLKDSKVQVQYKIITCNLSDEKYVYYGEEIKIWDATYGTTVVGGDVQLTKSIHILQKSDGSLFLDPGLLGLKAKIISDAGSEARKRIGAPENIDYSIGELARYVQLQDLILGPNDKGQYCGNFNTLPPLMGTMEVCQPIGGDYESTDKIKSFPGVYNYFDAQAKAQELASVPYINKVEYKDPVPNSVTKEEAAKIGTFLINTVTYWRYYSNGNGYWLFNLNEREASTKLPPSQLKGFSDLVLVKVQNDGKACVLDTKPSSVFRLSMAANDTPCN